MVYISLGFNCDPRVFIKNRLGLSKASGYRSCPFDLCITPFEALCRCLEDNFQHFFEGLRTIPWGSKNAITNSYGMIFNHEGSAHAHLFQVGKDDDLYYTRNDFEKFKERYTARINNFQRYVRESKQITFIIKLDKKNEHIGILTNLLNGFLEKSQAKNISLNLI